MPAYTVTVANKTSYRVLVIATATAEEAVKAFNAYLAEPLQQKYEAFEFKLYNDLNTEGEEIRSDYVYSFDPKDVRFFDGTQNLRRENVETKVTLLQSGAFA